MSSSNDEGLSGTNPSTVLSSNDKGPTETSPSTISSSNSESPSRTNSSTILPSNDEAPTETSPSTISSSNGESSSTTSSSTISSLASSGSSTIKPPRITSTDETLSNTDPLQSPEDDEGSSGTNPDHTGQGQVEQCVRFAAEAEYHDPPDPESLKWPDPKDRGPGYPGRHPSLLDGFEPPPEDPPRQPLMIQPLPFELVDWNNYGLHSQGWTVLDLQNGVQNPRKLGTRHDSAHNEEEDAIRRRQVIDESNKTVWSRVESLMETSKKFFGESEDYKVKFGRDDSEEGWTKIDGEKEMVTIRRMSSQYCPNELRWLATKTWERIFPMLFNICADLEDQMQLSAHALTRYAEKSLRFDNEKHASMLRLFRYENSEAKVVAEPHRDLGLLSLVIADVPGLEVWNRTAKQPGWNPIECDYVQGQCTLMLGRQLQHLTNSLYEASAHRVMAYGPKQPPIGRIHPSHSKTKRIVDVVSGLKRGSRSTKYRYSMVFVLRADEDVTIDYKALSSPVTGWDMLKAARKAKGSETRPETAGMLFERIRKAHYNINTHRPIREKQKKALLTRDREQTEQERMKEAIKDDETKAVADLNREEAMGPVERSGQDLLTPAVRSRVLKQGANIEGFCSLEDDKALAGG